MKTTRLWTLSGRCWAQTFPWERCCPYAENCFFKIKADREPYKSRLYQRRELLPSASVLKSQLIVSSFPLCLWILILQVTINSRFLQRASVPLPLVSPGPGQLFWYVPSRGWRPKSAITGYKHGMAVPRLIGTSSYMGNVGASPCSQMQQRSVCPRTGDPREIKDETGGSMATLNGRIHGQGNSHGSTASSRDVGAKFAS